MSAGQLVFVYSRLILGAVAVFLAIMLWAKTRDAAWMLMVLGIVVTYIEIICSVLEFTGITAGNIAAIILPVLRLTFFIGAFLVMVIRRYRHHH